MVRKALTGKFWREHRCGLQSFPGTTRFVLTRSALPLRYVKNFTILLFLKLNSICRLRG